MDIRSPVTASRKSILVVDDHPIILYGLRFLIDQDDRFAICGEASDVQSALAKAVDCQPAIIILDLVLGGRDGIDLIHDLHELVPNAQILVYSSQNEWRFARRVIQAGACGYVAKIEGLAVVSQALDTVVAGENFLSPGLRRRLLHDFVGDSEVNETNAIDCLSNRELQVLRLIGGGASTGEIGASLGLSVKTVSTYRERLKTKLGVVSGRALEDVARIYVRRP